MTAIIEFKTAIEAAMFQNCICGNVRSSWHIWEPINNTDKILRVLFFDDEPEDEFFDDEPEDESLYKYLRDLGAFKEVGFE